MSDIKFKISFEQDLANLRKIRKELEDAVSGIAADIDVNFSKFQGAVKGFKPGNAASRDSAVNAANEVYLKSTQKLSDIQISLADAQARLLKAAEILSKGQTGAVKKQQEARLQKANDDLIRLTNERAKYIAAASTSFKFMNDAQVLYARTLASEEVRIKKGGRQFKLTKERFSSQFGPNNPPSEEQERFASLLGRFPEKSGLAQNISGKRKEFLNRIPAGAGLDQGKQRAPIDSALENAAADKEIAAAKKESADVERRLAKLRKRELKTARLIEKNELSQLVDEVKNENKKAADLEAEANKFRRRIIARLKFEAEEAGRLYAAQQKAKQALNDAYEKAARAEANRASNLKGAAALKEFQDAQKAKAKREKDFDRALQREKELREKLNNTLENINRKEKIKLDKLRFSDAASKSAEEKSIASVSRGAEFKSARDASFLDPSAVASSKKRIESLTKKFEANLESIKNTPRVPGTSVVSDANQKKINSLREQNARIQQEINKESSKVLAAERTAAILAGNAARNAARGGGRGGRGGGGGIPGGPGGPGGPPPSPPNPPGGGGNFNNFINSLVKGRDELIKTDKAAAEFGERLRTTSLRLAAWGLTARLVFSAVNQLEASISEVIKLDRQVRRLIFFSTSSGGMEGFNKAVSDAGSKSKLLKEGFSAITNEARETGLAIDDVILAANTVARIGGAPFEKIGGALRATDFLRATEGLTQLESGLLSADRAAELLQAITSQFDLKEKFKDSITGAAGETVNFTAVAARLAAVANATSFGIEELGTVVTRFGSAALQVQRLTFDQSLELAGIAAKKLGTNASRTATVLRQVSTRIAEKAPEIEKEFGIKITTENGQLVGYDALLNAFKLVNELNATGRQIDLSRLLGDNETIADFLAISSEVGKIEQAFNDLKDSQKVSKRAADEVEAYLRQQKLVAEDATSAINKLKTSFVDLAGAADVQGFAVRILGNFTALIDNTKTLASALSSLAPLFTAAFAATSVLVGRKAFSSLAGAFKGADKTVKEETKDLFSKSLSSSDFKSATSKVADLGLVSAEERLKYNRAQEATLDRIKTTEVQLNAAIARQNALRNSGVASTGRLSRAAQRVADLQEKLNKELREEEARRRRIANIVGRDINKTAGQRIADGLKDNLKNSIPLIFGALAPTVGKALGSLFKDESAQAEATSFFQNVLIGGATGASVAGPIGAAIGAALAAVTSNLDFIFTDAAETARTKQLEIDRARQLAAEFARSQVKRQADNEAKLNDKNADAKKVLNDITEQRLLLEKEITDESSKGANVDAKIAALNNLKRQEADATLNVRKKENEEALRQLQIDRQLKNSATQLELIKGADEFRKSIAEGLNNLENNPAIRKNRTLLFNFAIDESTLRSELLRINEAINLLETKRQATSKLDDKDVAQENFKLNNDIEDKKIEAAKLIFEFDKKRFDLQNQLLENTRNAFREAKDIFNEVSDKFDSSVKNARQLSSNLLDSRLTNIKKSIDVARARSEARANVGAGRTESLKDRISRLRESAIESRKIARSIGAIPIEKTGVASANGKIIDSTGFLIDKEREKIIEELIKLEGELADATLKAKEANNFEAEQKIASTKKLIAVQENYLQQNVAFIEQSIKITQSRIDQEKELIDQEKELLESLKERAKREAEIGKKALENPKEFVDNLRKTLSAQKFIQSLGIGGLGSGQRLNKELRAFDLDKNNILTDKELTAALPTIAKIFAEETRKLGINNFAGLQKLSEAFSSAEGLGVKIAGLDASFFNELLARGVTNTSGKLQGEVAQEVNQQKVLIDTQNNLIKSEEILAKLLQEKTVNEEALLKIEKARAEKIASQLNVVEKNLNNAFQSLSKETTNVREKFKELDISMVALKTAVSTSSTDLEKFSALINALVSKLGAIQEDAAGGPKKATASGGKLQSIRISEESIGSLTTQLLEAFTSGSETLRNAVANTTIKADIPQIELQINANIINQLQGEEFIQLLTESLAGSGLESKVNEIKDVLIKLVKIEIARGSNLPLPE